MSQSGDPESTSTSSASIGGYELVDRLGSGGMGVVHLARSASGRQVAVKVVHPQFAMDEEFRTRFRQEVAAARRVSGAFTAPVVDADTEAEQPWMATLYVPGRTLTEAVKTDGPLAGPELRTLGLGLVEALRDIHQAGVVHRDLKPSNVLIAEDGPRVIDFGISRATDNQTLTITGRVIGTPPFMSPEQFTAPRDVTAASDVFSLGSLLVYAATGNRPFDGASPYLTGYQVMYEPPVLDDVPQPLRSIAERCLEKEPDARPDLAELRDLLRTLPDTAEPLPPGAAALAESRRQGPRPRPGAGDGPHTRGGPHAQDSRGTDDGTATWGTGDGTATWGTGDGTATRGTGDGTATRGAGDGTATRGTGDGKAGARTGRGRRVRRILIGVTAALAVTGLSVTAVNLASYWGATPATPTGSGAADDARPAALPAGWQPWRTSLTHRAGDITPLFYAESGCLPEGDALYCAGTGFTVAKIDAASGRVVWRAGTNPQEVRPLGVRDGLVYVYEQPDDAVAGNRKNQIVALDADTGKERWRHSISEDDAPAHLFSGGVLTLSASQSEFVAYGTSGQERWRSPATASDGSSCLPRVLGGVPYGLCESGDGTGKGSLTLLGLDPSGGTRRDLAKLPSMAEPLGVVDGQLLFAATRNPEEAANSSGKPPYTGLLRVNPKSGAVERVPLAGTPSGTATLARGVVYFAAENGTVTAVAPDNGEQLWRKATETESLSPPVVSVKYNSVYLTNRFGRLLALNRETGAEQWHTAAPTGVRDIAGNTPSVVLVKDAIVAVAGDTAFSVRPDRPDRPDRPGRPGRPDRPTDPK